MKKIYARVFLLCLLVFTWQNTKAYDFEENGIYYNIIDDSVSVTYLSYLESENVSAYIDNVVIPSSVFYNGKTYRVTRIDYSAFSGCVNLTSINIPESVNKIENNAFDGCKGLTDLTIENGNTILSLGHKRVGGFSTREYELFYDSPLRNLYLGRNLNYKISPFKRHSSLSSVTLSENVTYIGIGAFQECSNLASITIPNSVTEIRSVAFDGCTRLSSIDIPNNVTEIGFGAFSNSGLYSLTKHSHTCSTISLPHSSIWNIKGADFGVVYNNILKKDDWKVTEVSSGTSYSYQPVTILSNGNYFPLEEKNTTATEPISAFLSVNGEYSSSSKSYISDSPTIIEGTASYDIGDAIETITSESLNGLDFSRNEKFFSSCGLIPNTSYDISYILKLSDGRTINKNLAVKTAILELTTLQPKVVSSTCAIAAATTNISDKETNVGFQWKKYDAPESLKPSEGYTAIYDGQLEGYIKDLQPTYYNVRAFYKSANDTYFYGDWVTFDQTDFSYFEPTVHTYAATEVSYNSAKVKGYVMQGTDDVTEQGFEYWTSTTAQTYKLMVSHAPLATDDVMTVFATGQVMTANLEGLLPSTNYTYRAFVSTTNGTTYGEEQFFTTDETTGIYELSAETAEPTIVGYYDVQGRKLGTPCKGINIIKYSDGKTKKIFVR